MLLFGLTGAFGEVLLAYLWELGESVFLRIRIAKALSEFSRLPASESRTQEGWAATKSLAVRGLTAYYGKKQVFSNCSFEVHAGETPVILGKSGSGKTTLLRTLAQLFGPDLQTNDVVQLDGVPVKLDQSVGVVSRDALVFPNMLVWENVTFGRRARQYPYYARDLATAFGLITLAGKQAKNLSGGQRQRLTLACALSNFPDLLLLDEPLPRLTQSRVENCVTSSGRWFGAGRPACL